MRKMIRTISLAIVFLFLLSIIGGCGGDALPSVADNDTSPSGDPEQQITLSICVEGPARGATANYEKEVAEELARYFNAVHDTKINFTFEVLKSNQEARATQIDKLQTEIMAGAGPDIFVFSNTYLYDIYENNEFIFNNLNKAIHMGVFADLSFYIEDDDSFDMNNYHNVIMDAGAIQDQRYILPLTFSYHTAFITENSPLREEKLTSGTEEYFHELIDNGYQDKTFSFPKLLQLFENPIDYARESLNITKDGLKKGLQLLFDLESGTAVYMTEGDWQTIQEDTDTAREFFEVKENDIAKLTTLRSDSLATLAIAQADGVQIEEYPMPTLSGEYTAFINDAVAISANCQNKQEAYEYIKLFLDIELQNGKFPTVDSEEIGAQHSSLYFAAFPGWPVYKNADINMIYSASDGYYYQYPLEEESYAVKTEQITSAYFASSLDAKILTGIYQLNDKSDTLTDADISKVTDELYRELQAAASE